MTIRKQINVLQEMWDSLVSCGRFSIGLQRLATAQDSILPHGQLVVILLLSVACAAQSNSQLDTLLRQHRAQPSDWKIANQIAIAYTQAEQFDNASTYYRKVLSLNPTFIPARKNLGVVLWFANRKADAEKIFRGLLLEIPKDPVPHLYLGLALYERRQFADARRHFSQAGDLAMKNPEVLPMVLDSFLSVKDESIVPHALQFSDNTNLASVFDRHGKPEHAFAILSKAIAANPDQEQAYTMLAAFASAHQNDAYALKTVEQGLARVPGSAVLLLQKGLLLAFGGDREKARASLRAAHEANATWSLPLLSTGILELEAGHTEAAVEAFQKAITVAPNDAQAYYFSALAQSRTNDSGAIDTLRKALAIDPSDNRSRGLLGQLLISDGKLQEGVAELERALQSDKTNKRTLYQLGLAYRKLGRSELSKKYMAAFSAQKEEEDQTALVQIMKTIK